MRYDKLSILAVLVAGGLAAPLTRRTTGDVIKASAVNQPALSHEPSLPPLGNNGGPYSDDPAERQRNADEYYKWWRSLREQEGQPPNEIWDEHGTQQATKRHGAVPKGAPPKKEVQGAPKGSSVPAPVTNKAFSLYQPRARPTENPMRNALTGMRDALPAVGATVGAGSLMWNRLNRAMNVGNPSGLIPIPIGPR